MYQYFWWTPFKGACVQCYGRWYLSLYDMNHFLVHISHMYQEMKTLNNFLKAWNYTDSFEPLVWTQNKAFESLILARSNVVQVTYPIVTISPRPNIRGPHRLGYNDTCCNSSYSLKPEYRQCFQKLMQVLWPSISIGIFAIYFICLYNFLLLVFGLHDWKAPPKILWPAWLLETHHSAPRKT